MAAAVAEAAQCSSPNDDSFGGGASGSFGGGASGSFSGGPVRPASEIRFKEIAHYVGLSVVRNPVHGQKGAKGSRTFSVDPLEHGDLPSIQHQHGRSERLRSQMEWLRAEQRAETEQLRKLESSLSDAQLLEKRAKQKIAKQQELHNVHAQRAQDINRKLENLQERISTAETAPRREPKSRESPPGSGSLRADSRGATGSSSGLLARCAERAASSGSLRPVTSDSSWAEAPNDGALVSLREGIETAYMSAWSLNPSLPTSAGLPRLNTTGSVRSNMQKSASSPMMLSPPGTAAAASPSRLHSSSRLRADSPDELLRPIMLNAEEEAAIKQESRIILRAELKDRCGGAKEAFRKLDLNGSGNISCQEFADGVGRLGINWQQITGLKRCRDLFNMFDEDKDARIQFQELFPDEVQDHSTRPSTPDFWRAYTKTRDYQVKSACWQPASCDEELSNWQDVTQMCDDAQLKRKWIASTMRRLKTRGKSDARCREVVALHLPRGTGPKDREGVNTYSHADLKNTRKQYSDEVNLPMRRMWKVVGDYKDQRREQKRIYDKLYSVTEALIQRQKNEEAMANMGFVLLGGGNKNADQNADESGGPAMLKAHGWDDEQIDDLRKDFLKFADSSEQLGKRGFMRLMQSVLSSDKFEERKADDWWTEALERKQAPKGGEDTKAGDGAGGGEVKKAFGGLTGGLNALTPSPRTPGTTNRNQCDFFQFCGWWAENQGKRG